MKGQRGVTLVSLMMYLIVLSLLVGISSTIVRYFYRNSDNITLQNNANQKYIRVIQYLTDEIQSKQINSMEVNESGTVLSFVMKNGEVHLYIIGDGKFSYVVYDSQEVFSSIRNDVPNDFINKSTKFLTLCDKLQSESKFINVTEKKFTLKLNLNNVVYTNTFVV